MASQAVSSVGNFVVPALVQANTSIAGFGRFMLAFGIGQLIVVVGDGSIGQVTLVHGAGKDRVAVRAGAAAWGLVLGAVLGLVTCAAGLVVGGDTGALLVLTGLGAPALVGQYVTRALRFADGDPAGALRADLVWLGVIVVAAAADLAGVWEPTARGYLAVWLVGALAGSGETLRLAAGARPPHLRAFWQRTGAQAVHLAVDAGLARSAFVVTLAAAAIVLDDAAAGALGAAVLMLSPLSVVHAATSSYLVPRLVRASGIHVPPIAAVTKVVAMVVGLTVAVAVAIVAANQLTDRLGPFALEPNDVSGALFAATVVRYVGLGVWRGPLVALRVADVTRPVVVTRAVSTIAQLGLAVTGMAAAGLVAGAWGVAVGVWLGASLAGVVWVRRLGAPEPRD